MKKILVALAMLFAVGTASAQQYQQQPYVQNYTQTYQQAPVYQQQPQVVYVQPQPTVIYTQPSYPVPIIGLPSLYLGFGGYHHGYYGHGRGRW